MFFIIGLVLFLSIVLTAFKIVVIRYKHKFISHDVWTYEKGSTIAWLILGPIVAILIFQKDSIEDMLLFLLTWVVGFLILYFVPKKFIENKK